jgi:ABC-type multidrug transport system fused ATPase/permease subunit
MKSAVTDQIARKSFRLSPKSQVECTHGQQTSAIGADCGYVDQCFPYLVQIIVKPLTIVVGFVLLLLNLGPSALVVCHSTQLQCSSPLLLTCGVLRLQGVGIMALASPMMALFCSDLNKCRQQQLKMLDRRVRLTSEVLSTIRQIKLYAYEGYFSKRITEYREKELARLRKRKRSEASLSMLMVRTSGRARHLISADSDRSMSDTDTNNSSCLVFRNILAIRPRP